MFTVIHDANRISKAQTVLELRLRLEASKHGSIQLGYQGGGHEAQCHFVDTHNFWLAFADAKNRYWNALGIGNPFKADHTIIAEINPPKSGINRRVSGAFIEDNGGKVYLAHRGKVGGGRKGIGKKAFLAWYKGAIDTVTDGERNSDMIVIGALSDKNLIKKLANFTHAIASFKNATVSTRGASVKQKEPEDSLSSIMGHSPARSETLQPGKPSVTHGGRSKSFYWRFVGNVIRIKSTENIEHSYSLLETFTLIKWLEGKFGPSWFPLANNVEKMGNGSEKAGLGMAILTHSPGDITHAQGSSYLGVVMEEIGVFEWNGAKREIEWRIVGAPESIDQLNQLLKSTPKPSVETNLEKKASEPHGYETRPGKVTIWRLVEQAAIELTNDGRTPFTRGDIIKGVQAKSPEYQANSINPIIQGMTDNLKGGVPSAAGKNILHSVKRGQFVLQENYQPHQSRPEAFGSVRPSDIKTYTSSTPVPSKTVARSERTNFNLSNSLVLVSCVKSKLPYAAPASDLYTSPLFKGMKRLAEESGADWFILSSKYGFVDPDQQIEPYEFTLKSLGVDERRDWAKKVLKQLLPIADKYQRVVIFAGERYREFLIEPLEQAGVEVEIPMRGLSFGRQLAWLAEQNIGRLADVTRFYGLMDKLASQSGGPRTTNMLSEHRDWPERGVYFFFEPGELRSDSGTGMRIVRVGTHAVTEGAKSTLRQRLGQHRGNVSGGGNHRGSIFRLLIGQALLKSGNASACDSWGTTGHRQHVAEDFQISREELDAQEASVELAVTEYIATLPFLWLKVDDESSSKSLRGVIERNSIALLSNYDKPAIDPSSAHWLGNSSDRELVRQSGLWNQQHVSEEYDPSFLDLLDSLINRENTKIIKIDNDDTAYFNWLAANPNGYVLNVRRKSDPDYVVLHRASCRTISSETAGSGAYTCRNYQKWCGSTSEELREAAKLEGRTDGSFSKRCGLCKA